MDIKSYSSNKIDPEISLTTSSRKEKDTEFQREMGRDALGFDTVGRSMVQLGKEQKSKQELLRGINKLLQECGLPKIKTLAPGMIKAMSDHQLGNNINDAIADVYAKLNLIADMLDSNYSFEDTETMMRIVDSGNENIIRRILSDKDVEINRVLPLLYSNKINEEIFDTVMDLVKDTSLNPERLTYAFITNENTEIVRMLANREDVSDQNYFYITQFTTPETLDVSKKMLSTPNVSDDFADSVLDAIRTTKNQTPKNLKLQKQFVFDLLDNPDFDPTKFKEDLESYQFGEILKILTPENFEFAKRYLTGDVKNLLFAKELIEDVDSENIDTANKLYSMIPKEYNGKFILSENTDKYLDAISQYTNDKDYTSLFDAHTDVCSDSMMQKAQEILDSDMDTKTKANVIKLMGRNVEKEKAIKTVQQYPDGKNINTNMRVVLSRFVDKDENVQNLVSNLIQNVDDWYNLDSTLYLTSDMLEQDIDVIDYENMNSQQISTNEKIGFINKVMNSVDEESMADVIKQVLDGQCYNTKNFIIDYNKTADSPIDICDKNFRDDNLEGLKFLTTIPNIKPESYAKLVHHFSKNNFDEDEAKTIEAKKTVLKQLAEKFDEDIDYNSAMDYISNVLYHIDSDTTQEEISKHLSVDFSEILK